MKISTGSSLKIQQGKASFQYFAAYSATLTIITSGMHYGWPSPSLPKLLHENSTIPVSNDEGSWMAVMPLLGAIIGSLIVAVTVDVLGRKRTILLSSFPFFASWIMVAFSTSVTLLYTSRFIAGVADGLVFSAVPMYIGEIADAKIRGLLGTAVSVTWIFGILLINVVGSYLTITVAALVSSILPIVSFLTFVWMPESPYFLLMRGNQAEATKSLQTFRGLQDVDSELNRIGCAIKAQMLNTGKFLDLFTVESNRKAVYIMLILRAAQQLSGTTAITFYTQLIFEESGTKISSEVATIIYFSVQLVLGMFSSSIVDRAGRRPLLIASSIGTFLALLVEAVYFYLKTSTDLDLSAFFAVPVVALIVFVIVFSAGLQTIPLLMISEMFPANVKAFAFGLADIYFAILASIVSKFFQIMKDSFGMSVPFFGFAICSIVGLIVIVIFVPETKGKTLEDIQIYFRGETQTDTEQRKNSAIDFDVKEISLLKISTKSLFFRIISCPCLRFNCRMEILFRRISDAKRDGGRGIEMGTKETTAGPILQYLAAASGNLAIVSDGMHYGWPSPTLPQILNNTNSTLCISNEEGLWMAVMPLIGAVTGALAAANIVDYFGRKVTILATAVPFFAAWMMVAAATSTLWLHIARFIAGAADGVTFTVVPMYIGEISDAKVRGMLGSSCSVMWIAGFLIINIIGSYLSITNTALVSSVVPVLAFVTFMWMPESPYYLIMKNRIVDAKESLSKFRRADVVDEELQRMRISIQSKTNTKNTARFLDLFLVRSNRKAVFIVAGLRGFQQFSGTTAITFYAQPIFKEAGDDISPHHASMIYFSVQLLVTIVSSSIVDKAGRKPLLLISMAGSALALFLEGVYFFMKNQTDIDISSFSWVPVAVLIAFVIIFSLGMQSIPILMLGELFPTTVKAYALCLADVYYSIVATIASKFLQVMKDTYGMHVAFFGFSIFSVLGLVFIAFCVPETKGKNLEEIQEFLKGRSTHDHSKCDKEECVKV
nr:uncharacterized protein LOC111509119 [Leptinotarsa decemlineata]